MIIVGIGGGEVPFLAQIILTPKAVIIYFIHIHVRRLSLDIDISALGIPKPASNQGLQSHNYAFVCTYCISTLEIY